MKHTVFVLALAACTRSPRDLAPFPCADDFTCPSGLACVDGKCAAATIDSICTAGVADSTDCAVAAPGAICSAHDSMILETGACDLPCGSGCPTGRACDQDSGSGVCLIGCTDPGVTCPPNTYCLGRAFDSLKVCTPPAIGCRAVTSARRCTAELCQRGFDKLCNGGMVTCPESSSCSSTFGKCPCPSGTQAFDCDDNACTSQCSSGPWWCAPALAQLGCHSDLNGVGGMCECWRREPIAFDCDHSGITCDDLCR